MSLERLRDLVRKAQQENAMPHMKLVIIDEDDDGIAVYGESSNVCLGHLVDALGETH